MRPMLIVASAAAGAASGSFDINGLLAGLAVGGTGAAVWKVVALVLDKVVPSRSDKRTEAEVSFNALAKALELLSAEKSKDSDQITRLNTRIRELETEDTQSYEALRALREARDDAEARVRVKDLHIAQLTAKLAEYGARVTIDGNGQMHFTAKTPTGSVPVVSGY